MTIDRRAVFAGCARDCFEPLRKVLKNLDRSAQAFRESAFIFVENDSRDETASRLRAFGKRRPNFFVEQLPGLGSRLPYRTERLAFARNRYLEILRNGPLREFDYLVVMDLDNANEEQQSLQELEQAVDFLDSEPSHAAVFANQVGTYYDMWALRHPSICPGDFWEEVLDYALGHRVPDAVAYAATGARREFELDPATPPLEVESAFGGFGIYKIPFVLAARYDGLRKKRLDINGMAHWADWETCEHVAFHAGIRGSGGRLHVLPWLLNRRTRIQTGFNASAFRFMLHGATLA